MKKVLSISLGSCTRDHTTEAEFLGQHFWISRQGTDGNYKKYLQMYREYDGKVDAFGIGGAEFYLLVNGRRYYLREIHYRTLFQRHENQLHGEHREDAEIHRDIKNRAM
jgi:hypothetical protein